MLVAAAAFGGSDAGGDDDDDSDSNNTCTLRVVASWCRVFRGKLAVTEAEGGCLLGPSAA